ncbi:MAG: hypothetical protein EP343_32090 [Deltaproteobacteria bacterium]|nr:MAG: hypothetical protein EP343_32090 [Deltaproteobacteria bacterium]
MPQTTSKQTVPLSWQWWWGLWGLLGLPVAVLGVLKAWQFYVLADAPPSPLYLLVMVRWDLLLVLLWGGILTWIWQLPRAWAQGGAVLLLVLSGFGMMMVVAMEALCFWTIGSVADWNLLVWLWHQWMEKGWFHTFPDLPTFLRWFWLVPLGLASVPILGLAFVSKQTEEPTTTESSNTSWLWPTVLIGLLVPPVSSPPPFPVLTQQSFWVSILKQSPMPWWESSLFQESQEKPFSARSLQLINKSTVPRYNIIVVAMDSTRLASTTMGNPKRKTTPFLASLAKRSWRTQSMVALTPHPLRAWVPLLCGVYPSMGNKVWGNVADGLPARCLPTLLKKLGYTTAFFQPNSVFDNARESLIYNMGFSTFVGSEDLDASRFAKAQRTSYEDKILLEPVLAWIDEAVKGTQPFFLTWSMQMARSGSALPPGYPQQNLGAKTASERRYRNALRYQDKVLEQWYAELKRRKLLASTILVVVGLRGASENPVRSPEGELRPSNLHIPFLLTGPGELEKPRVIKGPRHQIDIVPTLMERLGLTVVGGRLPGKPLSHNVSPGRKRVSVCRSPLRCLSRIEGSKQLVFRGYHGASFWRTLPSWTSKTKRDKPALRPASRKEVRGLLVWRELVNQVYRADVVQRRKSLRTRFQPKVKLPSGARLGSYVKVIGATLNQNEVKPGGVLSFSVVFQALRRIPRRWRLFFHLGRKGETSFINLDHPIASGTHPLHYWKAGEFVQDDYKVKIPKAYASGDVLRLYVGMWSQGQGRITVHGEGKTIKVDHQNRLILAEFALP